MSRYGYGGYGGWAPYVPVGQKIAQGHAAAKKLAAKEKRQPQPIKLDGKKIAKTFWGLKWCENLDKYQDIANRLPRGATYVRNGSVADLVIEPGRVRAIVGGSEAYTIAINIKTLPAAAWKSISRDCAQEIESLFDLLQGKFSDGVMQRLTQTDGGLFPRKNEITMSCSCPDYAGVCKHIAATFYGVAARLDQQPDLLFKLRNVDHLELIGHAANAASLDQALGNAGSLADSDLSSLFGIELEAAVESPVSKTSKTKPAAKRTPAKKAATVVNRAKPATKVPTPKPSKTPKKSSATTPAPASSPIKPDKKATAKPKAKAQPKPDTSLSSSKKSSPKASHTTAAKVPKGSTKDLSKPPKTATTKKSLKPKQK